jgi:hypothetical protein
MDFLALKTRVAEEAGLDLSTDNIKVGSWINESYKFLSGMREWPWLLKSATIQTTPDITSLTASVDSAGTAVTLSATYATSLANDYYIQFSASDDWYLITAHTAGTDAVTIDSGYTGTSNLTAGACTIRRVYYSLSSDTDRIVNMRQAITDQDLTYVDPRTFDHELPDPTAVATPYVYSLLGLDSSQNWRVTFYPIPGEKINIRYRYYQKITELSLNTDVPLIPEKFHQTIIFTALAMFGHPYIDDDRVTSAERRAKMAVAEMVKQISPIPDKHSVMQPWDQRANVRSNFGPQFPPNFGRHRV